MSKVILSTKLLVLAYALDATWILCFVFLSFALPFKIAVEHSDFPNWPTWDKFNTILGCACCSVVTTMALFKRIGSRIRAGKDPLADEDDPGLSGPRQLDDNK